MRSLFPILSVLVCASLPAQLPRGYAVYSKTLNPNALGTPLGGLMTFHPRNGGFTDVTGLPGLLTGAAYMPPPMFGVGANSVLVRDRDGALFVGPIVREGNSLSIYEITLAGSAATVTAQYPIGSPPTVNTGILIDQMAWLPNGDLLFSHRGPMVGFPSPGISILNLTTAPGTVTNVPFMPVPANFAVNALAVDGTAASPIAYVGMFGSGPNAGTSQIFSVQLPTGGTPTPELATPLTGNISQLQVDCTGQLFAGVQGTGATSGLVLIGPGAPGTRTAVQLTPAPILNALAIDDVTGDFLLTSGSAAAGSVAMYRYDGVLNPVPTMPGNDPATGIAIRSSMATYGTIPPSAPATTQWRTCQNPGGAPFIPATGSNPFSLTLDVTPNTNLGLLAFSLADLPGINIPGPLPIDNLWIDPAMQIGPLIALLPGPTTFTVPLTIPAGLPPTVLYAQPLHFDMPLSLTGGQALVIATY